MTELNQSPTATRTAFVLRILASGESGRAGEEIRPSEPITIGREQGCDVVLNDPSVSRRHARVETTADGIKITDLDSANGVWLGGQRVKEGVLRPGQQVRVGSTMFECVEDIAALSDRTILLSDAQAPAADTAGFVLRVIEAGANVPAGTEFVVRETTATIGRAKDCTVIVDEKDVSRRHAQIERTPQGFRLTDLGSSGGTRLDERLVTSELLQSGQAFRLGSRVVVEIHALPVDLEREADADAARLAPSALLRQPEPARPAPPRPAPPPAPPPPAARPPAAVRPSAPAPIPEAVSEADFGGTIVMPVPPELLGRTRRVEDEGELLVVHGHQPFLLDDPTSVWYVVSGGLLIFTVAIEKGEPVGARAHFLGIVPGQCCIGFDLRRYGVGSGFLAVATQGTTVRKIPLARLQELATVPNQAPAVAALLDTWISGLSKALTRDLPTKRANEVLLRAGEHLNLSRQSKATAAEGVVWTDIWSGSVLVDDMATPVFTRKRTFFPVTGDTWIQPISNEFGDLALAPVRTADAVADPALWHGLDVFHQVICECEFVNKKLAAVDEYVRLQLKARYAEAAEEAAYDAIGSVLRTEAATPQEFLATGAAEPVFQACKLVGEALRLDVKEHPGGEEALTFEEKVAAIASASGFRMRLVALRDDWWNHDHGPMLGQVAATKHPVALLQRGPLVYDCVDPKTGEDARLTAEVSASLAPFAYTFYRPFPDGELRVRDVALFGAVGLASDFRWVMVMGVVVGLLGMVAPYFTGQAFDLAIPQADRGVLTVFGAALFVSALATSLFKFTQGVATVRIQARMEGSIQAAVWDRILNLPTSFFRQYAAGDLADRAGGVDAIQQLVAGAGVAAILGSFSGLFYVVQMFSYNLRLAFLAVGLTALFVGVTFAANYLQLTYQRIEIQLRGRIAGLVLNLITGVTKLRIAGAETHAFRVWAQQFAQQRRISFRVGHIQNVAAVFATVFPVISSIAIFLVMMAEQDRAAQSQEPGLTTGDFVAFNAAFGLFLAAMQALGDASLSLLRVVPIYERLKPILDTAPEVDRSKAFPGRLKGEIELSHVSFRYHADSPWIVRDLSLKIKAGEFVAFVGPSGCGKSTLMRLMLGFEKPTSGTIYYDGQDLSSLDLRLVRQQMGVVLQISRVMPTDIYRNIVSVSSRTIEEAWDAAERSGLAEDVRQMPMGMHTYVSEGGGTLSGGQRQRLMIARAIVNKPKVLFLDEATSALDNRTQAIVTESMDKMDATRIVIAHRLSTVINADTICYLEGGQILEMGPYQALMEKDGKFAELARRQIA